jgi:hypothetical protein
MSMLGRDPGTSDTCVNNHLYSGANLGRNRDGSRRCMTCWEDQKRRAAARRAVRQAPVLPPVPSLRAAACRGADPDDFAPLTKPEVAACAGQPMALDRVQRAVACCSGCPVRDQCGAWARTAGEQGVWGGEYLSRDGRLKRGAA